MAAEQDRGVQRQRLRPAVFTALRGRDFWRKALYQKLVCGNAFKRRICSSRNYNWTTHQLSIIRLVEPPLPAGNRRLIPFGRISLVRLPWILSFSISVLTPPRSRGGRSWLRPLCGSANGILVQGPKSKFEGLPERAPLRLWTLDVGPWTSPCSCARLIAGCGWLPSFVQSFDRQIGPPHGGSPSGLRDRATMSGPGNCLPGPRRLAPDDPDVQCRIARVLLL